MPELVRDNLPPAPPVPPSDDECCRSGCDPCVFDRYAEELDRYRAALKKWEDRHAGETPPASST